MSKKGFNYKIIRNMGIGYLYTQQKMNVMQQGIHDDLARIKSKGKTLADIPRKKDF